MRQNQSKPIYRKWQEGDPTRPHTDTGPLLFTPCLTVHWDNGEEMTFYYPFLMSVRLHLPAEHNLLVLRFTAEKLTLKGYGLKLLKRSFAYEKPSDIYVSNPRYCVQETVSQPVVFDATVEERQ